MGYPERSDIPKTSEKLSEKPKKREKGAAKRESFSAVPLLTKMPESTAKGSNVGRMTRSHVSADLAAECADCAGKDSINMMQISAEMPKRKPRCDKMRFMLHFMLGAFLIEYAVFRCNRVLRSCCLPGLRGYPLRGCRD